MSKRIVFVSYYTDNYAGYAHALRLSLDKFGLAYDIQNIASKGLWKDNVRFKPTFLLQMLRKHRPNADAIVWIDADGAVRRHPRLFWKLNVEIACNLLWWTNRSKNELLSGTVYLSTSEATERLLEDWIKTLKVAPYHPKPEQHVLQKMLGVPDRKLATQTHLFRVAGGRKIRFFNLPDSYTHIRGRQAETIYIEHKQASRLFRNSKDGRPVTRKRRLRPKRRRGKVKPRPRVGTVVVESGEGVVIRRSKHRRRKPRVVAGPKGPGQKKRRRQR